MCFFQKGKIEKQMAGGDIALEEEMAPCSVKTENWQGGARSGAGGAGKISTIAIRVNSSACVPKYEHLFDLSSKLIRFDPDSQLQFHISFD